MTAVKKRTDFVSLRAKGSSPEDVNLSLGPEQWPVDSCAIDIVMAPGDFIEATVVTLLESVDVMVSMPEAQSLSLQWLHYMAHDRSNPYAAEALSLFGPHVLKWAGVGTQPPSDLQIKSPNMSSDEVEILMDGDGFGPAVTDVKISMRPDELSQAWIKIFPDGVNSVDNLSNDQAESVRWLAKPGADRFAIRAAGALTLLDEDVLDFAGAKMPLASTGPLWDGTRKPFSQIHH